MLMLNRYQHEAVIITVGDVRIRLVHAGYNRAHPNGPLSCRLGFEAPPDAVIYREEIQILRDAQGRAHETRTEEPEGERRLPTGDS